MKRISLLILLCTITWWSAVSAMSSYQCGFEDPAENALWQLNTPKSEKTTWKNLWCIGTAQAYEGTQSIYISNDNGESAAFTPVSNIMIAWRELTFEEGEYDIAIDWKCLGDSNMMNLRLAWVPDEDGYFDDFVCGMNSEMKGRYWITDNTLTFGGQLTLSSSSVWNHTMAHFTSDGKVHRLVLVWLCNGSAAKKNPSACVDNIQISRNNCGVPTNMSVVSMGQLVRLTWTSTAEIFNLKLRRVSDGAVNQTMGIKGTSLLLTLPEGVYEPFIQAICQQDTSVWYALPPVIIYNANGFNYLSLTDSKCYFSAETPSDWHDVDKPGVLTAGRIDYGYASMWSRHTIHYYPDEYDSRTYNSVDVFGNPVPPLRTVPDGEIASVRIGSWELAARVSRVVYDFTVDTLTTGTLMIKYAIVLQMSGHEEAARPRFTLKIVDADTEEELSTCTTVDFSAKTGSKGWYNVPIDGEITSDQTVCWRDWTSVGLNLNEFHGKHVRVLLTVFGCTASIHYGYAYFTAKCSSGMIAGIQCGDTPTEQFIAPDGFNYRWYLKSDPDETIGTDRIFDVSYDDDRTYGVDITYKTNPACGFTLSACAIPRYPIPEAWYKLYQKDCKNYVKFANTSHIRTRNIRTGVVIDTPYAPEAILWNFGGYEPKEFPLDSVPWAPEFELPSEGGEFDFSLTAYVGLCDSTQQIHLIVPKAGPDSIVEDVQHCFNDPYYYKGRPILKDTTIIYYGINQAGCDSVHTVMLRFVERIETHTYQKIVEGDTCWFGGKPYTEAGDYEVLVSRPTSCDSVANLHLTVVPKLQVDVRDVTNPCLGQTLFIVNIQTVKGEPDSVAVLFDEKAREASFVDQKFAISPSSSQFEVAVPATVIPDWYVFTCVFSSKENGSCSDQLEVMVQYPDSFIQQRWDDVLGVLNKDYNGGYDFLSFQWYLNDEPIAGAQSSYLYAPNKLVQGGAYQVELMVAGQDRGIMTCPYIVPVATGGSAKRAGQKIMSDGHMYIIVNEIIYNAQGQPVAKIGN